MKANEMHYFSNLFNKFIYLFIYLSNKFEK